MNHAILRRLPALALLAALFAATASEAATFKRRAVAHRPLPGQFTKDVSGTVLDAVTGRPVIAMTVTIGTRSVATNANGQFEIAKAAGAGTMVVEFSRSGYVFHTVSLTAASNGALGNVHIAPTKTATVRRTNGTTLELDMESLKFGYAVPFTGYLADEFDEFCKTTDTTKNTINRSQMAKLTGPAQTVPAGNCCTGNADRMTLTLKSGEVMEVLFLDTCQERYTVDIIGRDHVTGQFVYLPVREIAEVVFP